MKPEIIPAILAHTPKELKEQWGVFSKIKPVFIQVDVCDGKFAGKKTVSVDDIKKLKLPKFEVDLMVAKPAEVALEWILAGAARIIFHIESVEDAHVVIDLCRLYNKEVGIALKPETPWSTVVPFLSSIDRVQFKGVEPGASGQKLKDTVVKKIAAFHAKHPKVTIAVDGGVRRETIEQLTEAGAKSFAVSSVLLDAVDAKKEISALQKLVS